MNKIYLLITLFIFSLNIFSSTINGKIQLEKQIVPENVKITFKAVSLTAKTDSTFTNYSGLFSKEITNGIYNIVFEKDGFESKKIENFFLSRDTTLADIFLQFGPFKDITGTISGTLYKDTIYRVTGNVKVNVGKTLLIEPGTLIKFKGFYSFTINGKIIAIGKPNNRIIFTSGQEIPKKGDWDNLTFGETCDSKSQFTNCIVEYGANTDEWDSNRYSMVYVSNYMTIDSCIFRMSNSHAIRILNGKPTISNCIIFNNERSGVNSHTGAAIVDSCTIYNNGWQGIRTYMPGTILSRNTIYNNYSGIAFFGGSTDIVGNRIYNNKSNGIHVLSDGQYMDIVSNIIYNNKSNGISLEYAGNTKMIIRSNAITHNLGKGIFNDLCESLMIKYNLFFGNVQEDLKNMPLGFGTILATNYNDTLCDDYFNIFVDPMYESTNQEDSLFMIYKNTSPCINAGDPRIALDSDGTLSDIGQLSYKTSNYYTNLKPAPAQLEHASIYPNPAKDLVYITRPISTKGNVLINIINQSGLVVKSYKSGEMEDILTIDIKDLQKGIYFIRIKNYNKVSTQKLIKL